jgi:hypothetical protein
VVVVDSGVVVGSGVVEVVVVGSGVVEVVVVGSGVVEVVVVGSVVIVVVGSRVLTVNCLAHDKSTPKFTELKFEPI